LKVAPACGYCAADPGLRFVCHGKHRERR